MGLRVVILGLSVKICGFFGPYPQWAVLNQEPGTSMNVDTSVYDRNGVIVLWQWQT